MRGAAVVWRPGEETPERVLDRFRQGLDLCTRQGAEVVVFPALTGCFFKSADAFLEEVLALSRQHRDLAICPGSFWEREGDRVWHASCLVRDGEVLLRQRQLYLARWEREEGLSRGSDLAFCDLLGFKTAIILSTDLFYPQVSRYAALSGADLILSPAAILGGGNFPTQLSGLWQNVQANLFFAVESGFKGSFRSRDFASRSAIHAPLAMTEKEDGFLALEKENGDETGRGARGVDVLAADLDPARCRAAKRPFDPLRQLNPGAYRALFADDTEGD